MGCGALWRNDTETLCGKRSKLPSLDPFNQFDPLGKDQDKYNLMPALSIIEDKLGERITELSKDWSKWNDPNDDTNVFDLLQDSDD